MIEKINTMYYEKLSSPNTVVTDLVRQMTQAQRELSVCEIGVGIGATSLALFHSLRSKDHLFLLDYHDVVEELKADLQRLSTAGPQLHCLGNSRTTLDSYAWTVQKLVQASMRFDLIFLDGAHNFLYDGIVCSLMDLLLNDGGYLVVDDVSLTMQDIINHNPAMAQHLQAQYSPEQLQTPQLEAVLACYLIRNKAFQQIPCADQDIKIFQKKGGKS